MAVSLRLDAKMEKELELCAKRTGHSKSELLRNIISDFLQQENAKLSAWELGKDLFGAAASVDGSLSINRKQIIKEMIDAKKKRH